MASGNTSQTVLITGSGRKRVGYVIAQHLAARGYNIAIHYHTSAQPAAENVAELAALGVEAEKFSADVSDEDDVREMIAAVVTRFGSLDVLVTTSSIWKTIPLEEVTADDVLASFRINTLGTFLCAKYAGLQMVAQDRGGSIITIGDSLIEHPYVDHAAYFTAKGAIPTLTRSLAVEFATRNPAVRVNCIEPGPVMFPDDLPEAKRVAHRESTLVKQADCPETVAHTVSFLIDNSMLTGCCIPLDGGRNVGREQQARAD